MKLICEQRADELHQLHRNRTRTLHGWYTDHVNEHDMEHRFTISVFNELFIVVEELAIHNTYDTTPPGRQDVYVFWNSPDGAVEIDTDALWDDIRNDPQLERTVRPLPSQMYRDPQMVRFTPKPNGFQIEGVDDLTANGYSIVTVPAGTFLNLVQSGNDLAIPDVE